MLLLRTTPGYLGAVHLLCVASCQPPKWKKKSVREIKELDNEIGDVTKGLVCLVCREVRLSSVGELPQRAWAAITQASLLPARRHRGPALPRLRRSRWGLFPSPDPSGLFLAAFYLPRSRPPRGVVSSSCLHWTCSQA